MKGEDVLQTSTEADAGVINDCAQLWWLPCSLSGTVESLANTLHKTAVRFLGKDKPIYLVFDRYYKYSIQGSTQLQRTESLTKRHSNTQKRGCHRIHK